MDSPVPVAAGQEIELQIESLGHRGEGVGRYQGFAVFVPRVVPGELVRARIAEVKKNYARGWCLEVLAPSPERVEAGCSTASECGGCPLGHISYPEQLRLKRELVSQTLQRIGRLGAVPVKPVLGMEHPWEYRNKAVFHLQPAGGKIALGFFREQSHLVADLRQCRIVPADMLAVAGTVREVLCETGNFSSEIQPAPGTELIVRKGFATGELMVILVTGSRHFPEAEQLAEKISGRHPQVVSIVWQVRTGKKGKGTDTITRTLSGRDHIREKVGGMAFAISPESFFQVNTAQAEVLVRLVLEKAALTGWETVIDAYCGTGLFSLCLAEKARRVIGVEFAGEAVRDARRNAALNGANNAEFITGPAEQVLPDLVAGGAKADVVVLDPPRQGCDRRALDAVLEMAPGKVVYVSCDPGTLARDLRILAAGGYAIGTVQPVDLFPHTSHVESIVLMTNCGLKGK